MAQGLAAAREAGLARSTIEAGGFALTAFSRIAPATQTLVVYIEGDGNAWRSRKRPSADPTPRDPVALRLAARDRCPAVLYLARPCQFSEAARAGACDRKYWTGNRYAPEVIDAMNAAIDVALWRYTTAPRGVRIGLVGYSGGAAVAALLAARREDVAWLLTVAGNLDHEAWTQWHGVTPLAGSLNPADFSAGLRSVAQVHLVGARDEIMPRHVTDGYLRRLGTDVPSRLQVIAAFDHHCCWEQAWPQIACGPLNELGAPFTPCGK